MQKFVNVRTTAESVKPLEIDDYHVYVNTGIKEIHEEAKDCLLYTSPSPRDA